MDVQAPTTVALFSLSAHTLTPSTIATITTVPQAPTPPTTAPSTLLQDLPNFGSLFGFDHRLKTLEANFSEFVQTNQFARAVSSVPGIVERYMDQRINEAVKVAIQIQSDRLCDEAQAKNEEFLKNLDENIQKIIKEQVKEQVKILIEKMEGNKFIYRSNEQRNLYKALVKAYESNKIILDTYGDTVTLKRRCDDDAYKDEEPSDRSDRGSKRRREGKEPNESATADEPMQTTYEMEEPSHPDFEIGVDDQPITESSQHPKWFSQQKKPPTPDRGRVIAFDHFINNDSSIYVEVPQVASIQLLSPRQRQQIMGTSRKLTNLTVEECFAFNVSLRMFTRSIVIQRRVEDLQLGVESYQKKLNLTRPDTYRSDLKRKEAYTAYSNPKGFIYQNKDKQNRLMQIDKFYKFSNGTLTDVRTALDDHLKGIQMKYLPQTIWWKSDKERAAAIIQAIDKQLKTMRIMRSLERFVGGRLYEGDFRMLQRTI
nr:hypothetical protein [Tanacetum cinerariifolium]